MNLKMYSKDALMAMVVQQQKELTLLRARVAEAESARERAEAGARSAWHFARTVMRRQ